MLSTIQSTLPKLTDRGLIYLRSIWAEKFRNMAEVYELYDIDTRQQELWESMPLSGEPMAKEMIESFSEYIPKIAAQYRKSFEDDKPHSERKNIVFELEQMKEANRMLNKFLGVA